MRSMARAAVETVTKVIGGLKKSAGRPVGVQATAGADDSGLTELQVWHTPAVNIHLLICHRPEDQGTNPMALVNVQVRDNRYFMKGMRLKARATKMPSSFILEGPLPRWRGKW